VISALAADSSLPSSDAADAAYRALPTVDGARGVRPSLDASAPPDAGAAELPVVVRPASMAAARSRSDSRADTDIRCARARSLRAQSDRAALPNKPPSNTPFDERLRVAQRSL
jgi:hypothetical protein